jgi:hypothetical protein
MPSTNRFGSKVGIETKARMSPLSGSIATIAPRREPNQVSTSFCRRMSSDITRFLPDLAGLRESERTARPPAVTSTSSIPDSP